MTDLPLFKQGYGWYAINPIQTKPNLVFPLCLAQLTTEYDDSISEQE